MTKEEQFYVMKEREREIFFFILLGSSQTLYYVMRKTQLIRK